MNVKEVCVLEEERLEAQLFAMEVEEMLGEEVCALVIPKEDMRAAEE